MNTFVPFASDEEVLAVARGLKDRTLPKPAWTHAAHFAAALSLLNDHSLEVVTRDFPELIRLYNEAIGVANTDSSGYHETITLASIRAAAWFLAKDPNRCLFETCNLLMASPLGKSDWLLAYYSRELLFSVEARRRWMDPDLQRLPF